MNETLALFDPPPVAPDPTIVAHPVGTELRTSDGKWGRATATFDATGTYRFRLSRIWDDTLTRRVCWIMLNPSTATEERTDPTIERTLRFARDWGCGASEVVNVFALRSTDPGGLKEVADPIGAGNDDAILAAALAADIVIAAWGVHATYIDRGTTVQQNLAAAGVPLHYLRLTKDGHPGHPLYVPAATTPQPWTSNS